MKTFYVFMVMTLCFTSCKKDDSPSDIVQVGGPPLSFDLLEVPLNATEVGLNPTLSWESAKNPAAGDVTYELYLGTEPDPTFLFEGGISETSFEVQDRLHLITDYYWKVVARDATGKTSQSPTHKFTTRYYKFPDAPEAASADFSPRYGHSSAVFQDKIWVFGGREPGNEYKDDVWYSTNGIDWTMAVQTAGFPKGWGHSTTVFDNKLWYIGAIGGGSFSNNTKSEIWNSSDGINWLAVNLDAPFSARHRHGTVVFDDKMWIIGGSGLGADNDIWNTDDGANWIEVTSDAAYGKRWGHTVTIFNNKIWVIGGTSAGKYHSDVWYSSDGINWVEATPAAPFLWKANHTTVVFDNKLWVMGGTSADEANNDVWYSSDGVIWTEATSTASFSEREGHASVVFDDSIWVMGGGFDPFTVFYNDVWALD